MLRASFNHFNKTAVKVSSNTLILSLREGYIALIPFFIVASLITLVNQWLDIAAKGFDHHYLNQFNQLVWGLFPLFTLLSFSYHLAKNIKIHTIAAPILVISCFTATTGYIYVDDQTLHIDHRAGVLYTLFMPIFCCYSLAYFERLRAFKIVEVSTISLFLRKHVNLIFPYMLVTTITLFIYPFVEQAADIALDYLALDSLVLNPQDKISLQLIGAHLLWFLGIHGDNTYHILVSSELFGFMVTPELINYHFFSTFIILGGTGCVWGLILACLLLKNAQHEKHIAKLSAPLAVFNISEVMLYALPIVFNPYIFIPFLLAPAINAFISYQLLIHDFIPIVTQDSIPWFTPVFVNAWILTESVWIVLLQALLIIMNVAIYYPFLVAHQKNNMSGKALDMLVKRYAAGRMIEEQAESRFATHHAEQQISGYTLSEVTDALNHGALTLYYQPKINPVTQEIVGFEALLRLVNPDKSVSGPWFLETLEEHNLLHVIDNFVIDQLEVDLEAFASQGLYPKISFNISPDNLLSGGYKRVIKAFSRFADQVEVELLESSYIEDFNKMVAIVTTLKDSNIQCAMDDFGTGYSCLSILSKLNIDTIKFDKSLLPDGSNEKAALLYKNLADLCAELGFKTVAEGIESKADAQVVIAANITCVQGFLYYKAMPIEEAIGIYKST
ncbi:EAL domain-containing protein [Pseudoalteromonas sp. MMG012]|uniref:EAL domain-containing protein n=1 Tax=Pseudoalteromonas sp. MMG012 TaxID=2822686 RepID=UPI001FFD35D4|nr:EAL domain-containing protein [Pseudoalteromonas sp. MMG012]